MLCTGRNAKICADYPRPVALHGRNSTTDAQEKTQLHIQTEAAKVQTRMVNPSLFLPGNWRIVLSYHRRHRFTPPSFFSKSERAPRTCFLPLAAGFQLFCVSCPCPAPNVSATCCRDFPIFAYYCLQTGLESRQLARLLRLMLVSIP